MFSGLDGFLHSVSEFSSFLPCLLAYQKSPHSESSRENTKTQLLQVLKLDAFMKLFVQVTPAKRSDMSRVADTSKESSGKKLNLEYAAFRQGEKIII